MDARRRVRIPLETFVKRSWPLLVFGAVLLVGASALLFTYAVSGKGRRVAEAPALQVPETAPTTTSALMTRALDGVLVSPEDARLQPYAVVVENMPEARPLAGPASANLVIEAPVEGGITRYLLVFDATTTVDAIGPVRSARPYFVDFAEGLDAAFAHVGGSPEALEQIAAKKTFRDLNEFWNGRFFWRSARRAAPHNVFTRSDLLREAAENKEWKPGAFKAWTYANENPEDVPTSSRGTLAGPELAYGGPYTIRWSYDAEQNRYVRKTSGGAVQKDEDGTEVTARNVVVLLTEEKVLDEVGRLRIRTTGRGKAVLYRDGKTFDLTWQRTAGEHLRFESVDGSDALFNRGTTWISVVTNPSVFVGANAKAPTAATGTGSAP